MKTTVLARVTGSNPTEGKLICLIYYRPQRSLEQGNVFTPVCLVTVGKGVCPTPLECAPLPECRQPLDADPLPWIQTPCLDADSLPGCRPPYVYPTGHVKKRVGRILLECILVSYYFPDVCFNLTLHRLNLTPRKLSSEKYVKKSFPCAPKKYN